MGRRVTAACAGWWLSSMTRQLCPALTASVTVNRGPTGRQPWVQMASTCVTDLVTLVVHCGKRNKPVAQN